METKILKANEIDTAAKILHDGGLVAFPTETVYGLGCLASSEAAFQKLVEAKKRPADKPFTLMCCNLTQAIQYCEIDVGVRAVLQAFFPGELTVLLKAREGVPHHITLGKPTLGVRIPNNTETLALIEKVDAPLLVPSANISNNPPETTCEGVKKAFDGVIDAIIEGECKGGKPSTIVDLSNPGGPVLVREGPIPFEKIVEVYEAAFCSVAIGSDHGGFLLKNAIGQHLMDRGFEIVDVGTYSLDSCDYPIYGHAVGQLVANKDCALGVVVCTSGEGIMISANKVPGIRCGIGYDDIATGKTREHNDANVIAFGAKYMSEEDVLRRVDIFVCEMVSKEKKHHRRVGQLEQLSE